MRWSILRLIWMRELRDQLRDRRTLFMIAVLPLLLYPVLGIGVLSIARDLLTQSSKVGICNASALPRFGPEKSAAVGAGPAAAWLATVPAAPVSGADWLTSSFALAQLRQAGLGQDYPPLLVPREKGGVEFAILQDYLDPIDEQPQLQVRDKGDLSMEQFQRELSEIKRNPARASALLREKEVDVLLLVAPDCRERLEQDDRPTVFVVSAADGHSNIVAARYRTVLERWQRHLKQVRLLRRGLAPNYDKPLQVIESQQLKAPEGAAREKLLGLLGKIFPFLLVMWSLAGALYPAVDLCAGEKERGTMETLLITPTSREEIVFGKFLAIWVFSAATALLNLFSMTFTVWHFVAQVPGELFQPWALAWCLLLLLPLSAFFSALCLAIGAYARSSKEGQYYLMPLFLITMPLIFITMVPGIKLEPFYAMVPITGVALLLQRLLEGNPETLTTWLYFIPVLGPMLIYGWLALRWAVLQFQREEVLFREAERLEPRLWIRSLLRERRPAVTAGQAMFCFGVIFALRWFTFRWSDALSEVGSLGLSYLAFVLAPTLLSVFALNRRPFQALGLRGCSWRPALMAVVLAVLLLLPMTEVGRLVLEQFPSVRTALHEESPVTRALEKLQLGRQQPAIYLLVMGLLAPWCEELAFRGLILGGLLRNFRPWTAVLLSSFLYAVYNASVFSFFPWFLLGVVLATFTMRTRSILPAVLFHCTYNCLLMLPAYGPAAFWRELELAPHLRLIVVGMCLLTAVCLLGRLWIRGYRLLQVNDPALDWVMSAATRSESVGAEQVSQPVP